MDKNINGYYKLNDENGLYKGYISFTRYKGKKGDLYSIQCKIFSACNDIFLVSGENTLQLATLMCRETGVFTSFYMESCQIDDFIAKAIELNNSVKIEVKYQHNLICSCELIEAEQKSVVIVEEKKESIEDFDPFDTVNSAYSWKAACDIEELHKLKLNHGKMFVRFIDSCIMDYGHFLIGNYSGEEDFVVIGMPARKQYKNDACGRWVLTRRLYQNMEYKGYILYYFNIRTGRMVRPVLMR